MGVIIREDELWFCRDCGAAVSDKAILDRLSAALTSPLGDRLVTDDEGYALAATVPHGCAACGGGRMVFRPGKMA